MNNKKDTPKVATIVTNVKITLTKGLFANEIELSFTGLPVTEKSANKTRNKKMNTNTINTKKKINLLLTPAFINFKRGFYLNNYSISFFLRFLLLSNKG